MPESNQQSSPVAQELYDCLRRDFGPMDIPWDTLAAVRSLVEQLEARDDALRDILDVTENWTRFKTDEDKLRAIAGIAKAALPKVSSPASEPVEPLYGYRGDGYYQDTESVIERKAREQRESPRGAPPSVLPDPDIDLRGASSPAKRPT